MMGKDIERMLMNLNELNKGFSMSSDLSITLDFNDVYQLLNDDYIKMKHIDELNFADKSNFNNSIGSPWSEFDNLMETLKCFIDYKSSIDFNNASKDELQVLSNYVSIISIRIVDFKWALITYHDYVQRAFDNIYNDNVPSITFSNDSRGTQTTGNLSQKISNNVSVKDTDITPY